MSNRRQRRAAQFGPPPMKLCAEEPPAHSNPVEWLRGVGAATLVLGLAGGWMKMFYLLSVAAIYLGLCLLVIDALYEKLALPIKTIFVSAIFAIAALFTFVVVMHKNPMQYEYKIYANGIELDIRNESTVDDYNDLDMVIAPSQLRSGVFVDKPRFLESYPACSIVTDVGTIRNGHASIITSPDGVSVVDYPDIVRIRCAQFPKESSIRVLVNTVTQSPDGKNIVNISPKGVPSIQGQFVGKFRTIDVNTKLTLIQ